MLGSYSNKPPNKQNDKINSRKQNKAEMENASPKRKSHMFLEIYSIGMLIPDFACDSFGQAMLSIGQSLFLSSVISHTLFYFFQIKALVILFLSLGVEL